MENAKKMEETNMEILRQHQEMQQNTQQHYDAQEKTTVSRAETAEADCSRLHEELAECAKMEATRRALDQAIKDELRLVINNLSVALKEKEDELCKKVLIIEAQARKQKNIIDKKLAIWETQFKEEVQRKDAIIKNQKQQIELSRQHSIVNFQQHTNERNKLIFRLGNYFKFLYDLVSTNKITESERKTFIDELNRMVRVKFP